MGGAEGPLRVVQVLVFMPTPPLPQPQPRRIRAPCTIHVSLQGVALLELPSPNPSLCPAFLWGIKVGGGVSLIKWAGQGRLG